MKPHLVKIGVVWVVIISLFSGAAKPDNKVNKIRPPDKNARNIILFIGDGMGLSQISAFLYANENSMALENFPVVGFQKTHSSDNLVTDSAGAATAISCGEKTYNNAVGVTADTVPCKTFIEEAEYHGWNTGMVVTSSLVHATPASFAAHFPLRSFYEQIATDFLKTDIDIMVGGGEKYFSSRTSDNRNLVKELQQKGYYITRLIPTRKDASRRDKIIWFTAEEQPASHFNHRRYLPDATDLAATFLKDKGKNGFFLMVEGSQIDWACHANNATMLLEEMSDFNDAIRKALEFARKDGNTLVVVTADHECGGMSVNNGSRLKKVNIEFTTNGHTATMVPVFAYGPRAELFAGIYDNTAIHFKLQQALGWKEK